MSQLLTTADPDERTAGDEAVLFLAELLEHEPMPAKKVKASAQRPLGVTTVIRRRPTKKK